MNWANPGGSNMAFARSESQVSPRRVAPDFNPETTGCGFETKAKFNGLNPICWLEILIAVASTLVVSFVASLSFGSFGVAYFLGKVGPLRDAYGFFSRGYDSLVDRLGRKVLQDPRDTPALRLMVSLSLSALPIFLVQIVIGEPRLLLAGAFYLSLYGLKFDRFVRMFSAKHHEAHRLHGYFSEKYTKVFGRYIEFFLGYLYGNVPELDRTFHVRLHHKENNGRDDTANSIDYDRTSRLDFLLYLSRHFWTTIGYSPYAYFKARAQAKNQRKMALGIASYSIFFGAIFIYNFWIGILFILVPLLCMNFLTGIIAWIQHAFYDPEHEDDYLAHTVTVLGSRLITNS